MKSIVNKILSVLLTIIMIALFALVIVFAVGKITNRPVFLFGKSFMFIMTDSMEDEIKAKSFILVEKCNVAELKEGDVIVFHSREPQIYGQLNTHRIKQVKGDHQSFVTKGDNNIAEDRAEVLPADVVAKYVKSLPIMSFLISWIFSPVGVIILFVLVGGIVVYCIVSSKIKENKGKGAE